MSNTAVGQLYKRIIDAVVDASRTDFEENGVENRTLVLLQETWQAKLSGSQRATFPWDPPPVAPPSTSSAGIRTEPTASSSTINASTATNAAASSSQQAGSNPSIKQETAYESNSFLQLPQTGPGSYSSALNPNYAGQRAAQLLQQQFGSQANNSISAMQAAGLALPQGQQRMPGQTPQPQYATQQQQQVQGQQGAVKQEPGLGGAQTDGAGDAADQWDAVLVHRNSHGDHEPLGRVEVDGLLRRQVEQMAQRLEGGGLMIPLDARKRTAGVAQPRKTGSRQPAPFDGAEDSDDLGLGDSAGEDAINSDLDDSDDGLDNGIEASFDGDMILCLYDKVQRVKNKWKCTLKDGVVTVDGKDYVFHKAQGEFEW